MHEWYNIHLLTLQRILEEERKEIERKLEWKPKPPRTGSKKTERNNQVRSWVTCPRITYLNIDLSDRW